MMPQLRIWALLGHRKGDNNQVLALMDGLGLPFETRTMSYNLLRKVPKDILGHQLISVRPGARQWLQPPWPDLIVGIGHRSVPVGRYVRRASGGRTKLVQLGNPRIHTRNFDLVITMPQYGLPESDNLVRLPFAMGGAPTISGPSPDEQQLLAELDRPHRLMVVGGPNKHWRVSPDGAAAAASSLSQRCEDDGGTLIVIGSPRTQAEVMNAIERALAGSRHHVVSGRLPRYATLLQDADEIHVTADSVSMLSEAIFTGKPVGMIPIQRKKRGTVDYAMADLGLRGGPLPDLRAVWEKLGQEGLVGTISEPRAGSGADPLKIAVEAVHRLIGHTPESIG